MVKLRLKLSPLVRIATHRKSHKEVSNRIPPLVAVVVGDIVPVFSALGIMMIVELDM